MIKKDAQDLVERLDDIHARLEDIIQDYMNEYAPYGWDATCTDIVNIAAHVDCVTLQLKYAKVEDQHEETVEKGDSDTVRDERTRLSVGLYQVRILSYIVGKLSEV